MLSEIGKKEEIMNLTWGDHTVSYIFSGQVISVTTEDGYYTIGKENPNFDVAKEALIEKDYDKLIASVKPIKAVENIVRKIGSLEITDDEIYFGGKPIHGVLVQRILDFNKEGFPTEPLVLFLGNLLENPTKTAVDELYEWLENASHPMPITDDGCFLAYKRVKKDFYDIHSHTIDYSVGNVVEIPRNAVDDNRNNTCSYGLHFCSLGYIPGFGSKGNGDITILVKINPKDVVAFPPDSSITKGRTCKMEVIGIHESDDYTGAWNNSSYVDTSEDEDVYDDTDSRNDEEYLYDFYATRSRARHFTRERGFPVVDFGVGRPYSRWGVLKEELETPARNFFHSRKTARDYIRRHGGKLVDNGFNVSNNQRWEVV